MPFKPSFIPPPDLKNSRGDTIGTVDSFLRDSEGNIREVTATLFPQPGPKDGKIISTEEYGSIMWNANISKSDALDVLFALQEAGVFPMRKAT